MGVLAQAAKATHDNVHHEAPKHKKHKAPSEAEQPAEQEQAEPQDDSGADEPGADAGDNEQSAGGEGGDAASSQQPPDNEGPGEQGESDSGEDQQEGGEGAQQGQPPVQNAQAPGAGDDTSGGADTPTGDTEGGETPGEDTSAGTGSEQDITQVPMSPGLQHEYQHVDQVLMQLLYGPGPLAQQITSTLAPDGQHKIKTATMMSLLVLRGLYKKTQFPLQIGAHILHDVVGHVMDLGQQVKQIQYSDHDATLILAAANEGAMRIFGVTKGQARNFMHLAGRDKVAQHSQNYHSSVQGAIAAMNQGSPVPGTGGEAAGPQTGAPAGTTAPPNVQGAPPQEPPPPATGGQLAQGAAMSGGGQQ